MRIYNFSRILAVPFAICFCLIAYKSYTDVLFKQSILLIPLLVILVFIYVFNPQLDHWWISKYPVKLDDEVGALYKKLVPFYSKLTDKERFENRIVQFLNAKIFYAMSAEKEKVPHDIQALISHIPIQMTYHHDKFMFGDFDRIVLYKHPFPTPGMPFLHTVETEVEDGVILMAMDHLLPAFQAPTQYYHIGWHAFADAFIKLNPKIDWPILDNTILESLEQVSQFSTEQIIGVIGIKTVDPLIVAINYYFVFPDRFAMVLPELKKDLDQVFL